MKEIDFKGYIHQLTEADSYNLIISIHALRNISLEHQLGSIKNYF